MKPEHWRVEVQLVERAAWTKLYVMASSSYEAWQWFRAWRRYHRVVDYHAAQVIRY